jgi:hypothetical protein
MQVSPCEQSLQVRVRGNRKGPRLFRDLNPAVRRHDAAIILFSLSSESKLIPIQTVSLCSPCLDASGSNMSASSVLGVFPLISSHFSLLLIDVRLYTVHTFLITQIYVNLALKIYAIHCCTYIVISNTIYYYQRLGSRIKKYSTSDSRYNKERLEGNCDFKARGGVKKN